MQAVLQQQMVPRAMLSTKCGDLFVFDLEALAAVMATISVNQTFLPSLAQQGPSATCSPPDQVPVGKDVVDGFTIQQWAEYAKLKARIASTMCKENGRLKQQSASVMNKGNIDVKPLAAVNDKGTDNIGNDSVYQSDPWRRSASKRGRVKRLTPTGARKKSVPLVSSDWSKWQGCGLAMGSVTSNTLCEPLNMESIAASIQACKEEASSVRNEDKETEESTNVQRRVSESVTLRSEQFVSRSPSSNENSEGNTAMSSQMLEGIIERAFERQEARAQSSRDDASGNHVDVSLNHLLRDQEVLFESRMDDACKRLRSEFGLTSGD